MPEDPDRTSGVTRRWARVFEDGLQFGKYRIVRLLGIGGMSEIYEAVHLGLKKRVALKVMRRDLAESAEGRKRFIAEGVNAARLRHTNVVDVTDVGEVDELPYLVMNLLEGEDLGRVFDRQGRIPTEEIIDLLLPVASAVAHGHDQGVVHRDLKPDNIFLHREGVRVIPKVLDFGVSRVMSARRITLNASVFGTPHYMSPEQARGGPTDARTDQYSLGVILYEGITGRLPRDSNNPLELLHAVAYDSFQPPSEYSDVAPELERVILRAMSRDPDERYDTMREFALALVPFASEAAREYWSIELGATGRERISETRVPQPVRHPSPAPSARVEVDPVDRTGTIRKRSAPLALAPSPPPRISAIQILPTAPQVDLTVGPRALQKSGGGRQRLVWFALVALPLAVGGAIWTFRHAPELEAPVATALPEIDDRYDVDVRTEPDTATLTLDGKIVAVGRFQSLFSRDGVEHELAASAEGWTGASVRFRDRSPAPVLKLERIPPADITAASPVANAPAAPAAPMVQGKALKPWAARLGQPLTLKAAPPVPEKVAAVPSTNATESLATQQPMPVVVDPPIASPQVAVVETPRPKVRLVDEHEPKIQLVE